MFQANHSVGIALTGSGEGFFLSPAAKWLMHVPSRELPGMTIRCRNPGPEKPPFHEDALQMLRFGIIGTNAITQNLLAAAAGVDGFQLNAVYSRSLETARTFAARHGAAHSFDNLEAMLCSDVVDAVYIASPNALHCQQALLCLRHGKHVLCEKPLASNLAEVQTMIRAAREHGVVLMEAMKTCSLPNYRLLKENLHKIGPIRHVASHYCQYSSRYDRFKAGEVMNAFRPELSNGALMDLGVYALYPVIDLLGLPQRIQASAVMLGSGIDGLGAALLSYPQQVASVSFSKISDMAAPSEIQGELGTLLIDHISQLNEVNIRYRDGREERISELQSPHPMAYELADFMATIARGEPESQRHPLALSEAVASVMQAIRREIGLVFPADQTQG